MSLVTEGQAIFQALPFACIIILILPKNTFPSRNSDFIISSLKCSSCFLKFFMPTFFIVKLSSNKKAVKASFHYYYRSHSIKWVAVIPDSDKSSPKNTVLQEISLSAIKNKPAYVIYVLVVAYSSENIMLPD